MISEELNIKYIREKTGLVKDDELIPIILEMIKDSYKAGLCQAEHDNTMDLIEENKQLKEKLERVEKARKSISWQIADIIKIYEQKIDYEIDMSSEDNYKEIKCYEDFNRKLTKLKNELDTNKGDE